MSKRPTSTWIRPLWIKTFHTLSVNQSSYFFLYITIDGLYPYFSTDYCSLRQYTIHQIIDQFRLLGIFIAAIPEMKVNVYGQVSMLFGDHPVFPDFLRLFVWNF